MIHLIFGICSLKVRLQGSFMVFHGFWLVFMVFEGSFMGFHSFWFVFMVFQGSFMVLWFCWFPWFFKVVSWFYGFLLVTMVFQGSSMVFHGFWWVSMVFSCFWLVSVVFQGSFMKIAFDKPVKPRSGIFFPKINILPISIHPKMHLPELNSDLTIPF